jgi:heavy metal sensor kinase
MRPLPLKWRLSVLVTLVVAAIIVTMSVAAYLKLRAVYLGHIDRMLSIMARGIVAELDQPQSPQELEAGVRRITESPWRGTGTHFRLWIDGKTEDLTASLPPRSKKARFLWNLPAGEAPALGGRTFFDLAQVKKHYRALWERHSTGRGEVNVVIAHPSSYEHRRLREILTMLLILGGGLVLATAALGTRLVLLALRPIDEVAAVLSRVTQRDLREETLSTVKVPRELDPFVHATTELLGRVNKALQRQKQFTADASHELRTPLSVAQSTLQSIRAKDRDVSEYRQAIDETLQDLGRLGTLLDQLLTLARIDETDGLEHAGDVRLDELLRDLAARFNDRASHEGGRVICEELVDCRVRGNEQMLSQLFGNLLDNAVKYGPRGGTVRVRAEHGPGVSCTVSIQDDGGGISPGELPRLFDRFFRAGSSRRRDSGGAGLGLAIAREIALRHGGDLWATSSPENRTTFHACLPCASPCADDRAE